MVKYYFAVNSFNVLLEYHGGLWLHLFTDIEISVRIFVQDINLYTLKYVFFL